MSFIISRPHGKSAVSPADPQRLVAETGLTEVAAEIADLHAKAAQRIHAAAQAGVSRRKIAETIGFARPRVNRILSEAGASKTVEE